MAGGMGARERGPTLAERSGLAAAERTPAGACHCWVIGDGGARHPGLLLEWRRQAGRWLGLVAYLQIDEQGGYALVQTWLDADLPRATGIFFFTAHGR
jgi:hypothetical protein